MISFPRYRLTPGPFVLGAVALCMAVIAQPAIAQSSVAYADSLLKEGEVTAAEIVYYRVARERPRDPEVRLALGRFLAARGAARVGAVLMEEARFFGADPARVAVQLAPVYARIGDWRTLAALPASPLSGGEIARARWLTAKRPRVSGPDSARVPYTPGDSRSLGSVRLVIGRDTVDATIDPAGSGLTLDMIWAGREEVRLFSAGGERDARRIPAATLAARAGALTLHNVPTRFEALGASRRARIGLDYLGSLAPTFDPATRTVTLRRSGRLGPDRAPGVHVPVLMFGSGVFLVKNGVWALANDRGRETLRGVRWTFDARRGEVVLGQ